MARLKIFLYGVGMAPVFYFLERNFYFNSAKISESNKISKGTICILLFHNNYMCFNFIYFLDES